MIATVRNYSLEMLLEFDVRGDMGIALTVMDRSSTLLSMLTKPKRARKHSI